MSLLFRIGAYVRYRLNAKNRHGVHSPFVYDFNVNIVSRKKTVDFSNHPAEIWRRECLANTTTISVLDFGTGQSGARKISTIARRAAKSAHAGQLLHRIVKYFAPKQMMELGTSLGITTLYQLTASPDSQFITIEGCPETALLAKNAFEKNAPWVEQRIGSFENELLPALQQLGSVDYIYIDGNHRKSPTLNYFQTCLPFVHNDTLLVFDDIHWSKEMEEAWKIIQSHPRVQVTIDVFEFGLVFFRKQQAKEHFVLRG